MASLSNNYQLLNGLQSSTKPAGGKKGKKKPPAPSTGETSVTLPEVQPRVVPFDAGETEGFQLPRRPSYRSKSAQNAAKGVGSAELSPLSKLMQGIEADVKSARTPEDWLSLWRLWIMQVQDQMQQSITSEGTPDIQQAVVASSALEQSAAACMSTPGLQDPEPLAELLDTFLADASTSHAGLARAILELGQATAKDSAAARKSAAECVAAVLQHYKSQHKPQQSAAALSMSGADVQAGGLVGLEGSIAELEAALAQPKLSAQDQARRAQQLYTATQQRLAMLSASSPVSMAAQQAVSQVDVLTQHLESRMQESAAIQEAQSKALQARAGLLDEEQLALASEIEELQSKLTQLSTRLAQVQQETVDVSALQASRTGGRAADEACQRQLDALRNLQAAVAGCASSPDTPSLPDSGAPLEEATQSFTAAVMRLLQANLQLQAEAMTRASFACERMVLAAQQAGHLRSLHFEEDAAKAAKAASQHETTLMGLVQESSAIVTASLAAGKAANSHSPAMATDTAAPSGQAVEALLRRTEQNHEQIAAFLQPDFVRTKTHFANGGPAVNHRQANGSHLRSPDTTSSDAVSAAPSLATSSVADSDPHANGSSESSRGGLAANGSSQDPSASLPNGSSKSRRRRNRKANAT